MSQRDQGLKQGGQFTTVFFHPHYYKRAATFGKPGHPLGASCRVTTVGVERVLTPFYSIRGVGLLWTSKLPPLCVKSTLMVNKAQNLIIWLNFINVYG